MNNGQRTVAGMLAVVAVLLGLNLIVRGSPTAVAAPPVPEPTVIAGAAHADPNANKTRLYRFWSDGTVDYSFLDFFVNQCVPDVCSEPIVVIPSG